jgi:hypothetical protein
MKPKIAGYALRLPVSLKEEAEQLAAGEGSSLNQFIIAALAEKVSSMGGKGATSKDYPGAGAGDAREGVASDEVASDALFPDRNS